MAGGRLTRQELGWLLAQEAQGAAKALRAEVTELQRGLAPGAAAPRPVEHRLNALDQAIVLLSGLPEDHRQRRKGRVDIAGLLYELVPGWSITIAPGAGTEVYGDSQDFRRILQVLLSQSQGRSELLARGALAAPEISVRREGEWVRISVQLGPDAATPTELDRTWLTRMTLRYGGRLELQGKTQSILLPAESSSQGEIEALRRELAEAQLLGETYAKELAAVFSDARSEADAEADAEVPPDQARLLADQTLNALRAISRAGLLTTAAGPPSKTTSPEADSARRRVNAIALLGDLETLPASEQADRVDLEAVLLATVESARPLAAANGCTLELSSELTGRTALNLPPHTLQMLLRATLEHGLAATPRGEAVRVLIAGTPAAPHVRIEDGGPNVPAQQAEALLGQALDPRTLGRPMTPELPIAHCLASRLGTQLVFGTSAVLRTEVTLSLIA